MAIRTEIGVRLPNSPGALAAVCQALADAHVNILALGLEASGHARFVPDNPLHAAGLLRERRYAVEERDVLYIHVPNTPGALARVTRLLAQSNVNVDYAYGSVAEGTGMTAIVIGVPDVARASAAAGV